MNPTRRNFLKAGLNGTALMALFAAGMLRPMQALAAAWNKSAFQAKSVSEALDAMSAQAPTEHKDLQLKAPEIAENGAVVPIEVISTIPGTTSISILVDNNPSPLSLHVDFSNGAVTETVARLKFAKTSLVRAIAKADGKFYVATREVKVTAGGCGG